MRRAPLLLLLLASPLFAGEGLKEKLKGLLPDHEIGELRPTPVGKLYEVEIDGQIYYLSSDGRYLVQGDVIDLKQRVNLTEERRKALRKALLAQIPDEETIVFSPKNPKHTVTVFTDVDCGYCRRFHSQIEDYMARGIKVRYLFFPRAGKNSHSYEKAVAVWCSENRQEALTRAKRGEEIPLKKCPNPVDRHMELARKFGLEGTPLLVLEDGTTIPGYVPPEQLAKFLEEKR